MLPQSLGTLTSNLGNLMMELRWILRFGTWGFVGLDFWSLCPPSLCGWISQFLHYLSRTFSDLRILRMRLRACSNHWQQRCSFPGSKIRRTNTYYCRLCESTTGLDIHPCWYSDAGFRSVDRIGFPGLQHLADTTRASERRYSVRKNPWNIGPYW